jgi:hypothetical protein
LKVSQTQVLEFFIKERIVIATWLVKVEQLSHISFDQMIHRLQMHF